MYSAGEVFLKSDMFFQALLISNFKKKLSRLIGRLYHAIIEIKLKVKSFLPKSNKVKMIPISSLREHLNLYYFSTSTQSYKTTLSYSLAQKL